MTESKEKWKEKIKVKPQVAEQLKKNLSLGPREATKLQKRAFKSTKNEFKLSKRSYKEALQKHKLTVKTGDRAQSINHLLAKKNYLELKKKKIAYKKAYRRTKKMDTTRVTNQAKAEVKGGLKREVKQKALSSVAQEDTLKEGVNLYEKTQQTKFNLRMGLKATRSTTKVGVKTVKGSYGMGNRLFNFSKGRGFQRTPKEFSLPHQLMKKARNSKMRLKMAKVAKKSERGLGALRSLFTGKKSAVKVAALILKNPISWVVLGIIVLIFLISGAAISSQKPAIVQEERDLTETWTYFTKLDADHTDDEDQFYSAIDDVLFYTNYRFDDFKLLDMLSTGTKTYETFLSELWADLNGKKPNYQLKTMNQLETDKKSGYFLEEEQYKNYQEVKKELGYQSLDDLLMFPVQTESLIVNRRFGYEKKEGKISLYNWMDVVLEANQPFLSPMQGIIKDVSKENQFVLEKEKTAKLTVQGVNNQRLRKGMSVDVESFIGNTKDQTVSFRYEKYDEVKKEWYTVNPAFYFPKVTYTQTTILGSTDFSPGASVEKRAQQVYDYLTKKGYTKEGISAMLGNFSVESGINPKRAEGDYLNPPVGAYGNSWDEPAWLAMGGPQIYGGRFGNILHRGLGLGQWTDTSDGGRRHTLLLDYAKQQNKKWYDLQLQLDFIFNGDAPGSRTAAENVAKSKVASTVPDLTTYFLNVWEGNPGDKVAERIQAAQNWFTFLSQSAPIVNGSSSEVFEQYKGKMNPLPTEKETKAGLGWPGNAYAPGNCTWYVYNRFAQLGKSIHPTMGNANQWVNNYGQTQGATLMPTPEKGDAVIFINGAAGASPQYGHVAYVEHVNSDGTFVISEMNVSGLFSMNWRVLSKQPGMYFMRVK
ncbi:TPA: CHAP domain-containing protein [Enterococcus faecalis]|nr:CHAP domain-containing protein [Enterococcus faecalis]HAP4570959.1 CHAP domain-containing protein [Enterococcus faecalis]HAP4577522.1 CHAP domain-containing protein [Enterococcus faecalis]HAP4580679.1 CHAP domain-containing protein [Enterococcus faecalis]HAP4587158.1 CHAP domain-containing protein [Enterococcus faecalis]